jgi:two-component system, OmpR family, response regulator MprA
MAMETTQTAHVSADRKRILMIDDDINLVNVIRTVLETRGYEFHSAHTATEGLERIRELHPDLIILDVIMEDFVAGFRVVTELRTAAPDSPYKRFETVPILMLTSVTSKTTLDFSDRVGTALLPVDVFLEKPVRPFELLEHIQKLLR